MERCAVNFAHNRLKSRPERAIAVTAAKPAEPGEIVERQMAGRTDHRRQTLPFGGRAEPAGQTGQDFRERKRMALQRGMESARRSAFFAERQGYFLVIHDLGKVNLRFSFSAILTQHIFSAFPAIPEPVRQTSAIPGHSVPPIPGCEWRSNRLLISLN
jgi:hypothetical protein